ncbi:MAG: glycosyl hydrolase, partial [bacterium]
MRLRLVSAGLLLGGVLSSGAQRAAAQASVPTWPAPTRNAKPWTRWWWLGSAVDSVGITRQLQELSRAGFGGVEVTSIYGARGAEAAYVPYLSTRWVALLRHTITEAKRLGMAVDLPPGSGWRMGGPRVPDTDVNASLRIVIDSSRVGDTTFSAVMQFSGDNVKRPAPGGEGRA